MIRGSLVLFHGFGLVLIWSFLRTHYHPFWIIELLIFSFICNSQSAESTDSGSAQNTASCRADALLESESPISKKASDQSSEQLQQQQRIQAEMASDVSRAGGPPPNHQTKTQDKVGIYAKICTLLLLQKPRKSDLLLSLLISTAIIMWFECKIMWFECKDIC